jgi:hypothetical protein
MVTFETASFYRPVAGRAMARPRLINFVWYKFYWLSVQLKEKVMYIEELGEAYTQRKFCEYFSNC